MPEGACRMNLSLFTVQNNFQYKTIQWLRLSKSRVWFFFWLDVFYLPIMVSKNLFIYFLYRPPCIPYVGLVLQDLTFVHIGNPDTFDGKVNFAKRWQQFNILVSLQQQKIK